MPKLDIVRSIPIVTSPRVKQIEGFFDIPAAERSEVSWQIDAPLDEREWNIGLIVGPSGCGKSTIAKELFGERVIEGFDWPHDAAILDAFGEQHSVKKITAVLHSVGLGTAPAWLRPYEVLSTGEKFRATVARAILDIDGEEPIAIDEWTSVVDRQVAKVASSAVAKAVRRSKRQLVAVCCHDDVIEWLQPDWILQPHAQRFDWRCLQRRPELPLSIYRVERSLWRLFSDHHYINAKLSPAAVCYGGFIDGKAVGFVAHGPFPHPNVRNARWVHRVVILPDWQGLGIAEKMLQFMGWELYKSGKTMMGVTAHPAMIRILNRSPRFYCPKLPKLGNNQSRKRYQNMGGLHGKQVVSQRRRTAAFWFVPSKEMVDALPADIKARIDAIPKRPLKRPKIEREGGKRHSRSSRVNPS